MPRPRNLDPLVPLQIRLPKTKSERLEMLSLQTYRSKASLVTQAVDEFFAKLDSEVK